MKKCKKANVITHEYVGKHYEVQCPHCKLHMKYGNIQEGVLRISCWGCKNPIELVWEEFPSKFKEIKND